MTALATPSLGRSEFERLVRDTAPAARAVIGRFIRNRADADDVLQETYLAAWQARGSFAGRSAPQTWIHRIAVNAALSRLRQRKTLRATLETSDDAAGNLRPSRDADAPERLALRDLVWSAVDALPEDARLILILRDVEGLSSREVAERLGIADAAVRQRLHRARQAVAERLRPELCDSGDLTCGGRLDLLLDYLDRQLDDAHRQAVTDHVESCSTCSGLAAAYQWTISRPRESAAQEALPELPSALIDAILARTTGRS